MFIYRLDNNVITHISNETLVMSGSILTFLESLADTVRSRLASTIFTDVERFFWISVFPSEL